MFRLKPLSLKEKLILTNIVTSGIGLLLAGVVLLAYDFFAFKKDMEQKLVTQAKIIGENAASALYFNDRDSAETTLSALAADPHIMAAAVFQRSGERLAVFRNLNLPDLPPVPKKLAATFSSFSFNKNTMVAQDIIIFDGERIGFVWILSDLKELRTRTKVHFMILAAILLVSGSLSTWLSIRLQRGISGPILHLVKIAKQISSKGAFNERAAYKTEGELGLLIDTFNKMLDEIQKRGEKLERQVIKLEAVNQELQSFSYSVAHDLRSPLRSISGFSQALEEDYGHLLDEEGKDYLNRVRNAVKNMSQLITDLLNLSRITRSEMKMEEVNMTEIAREIAEELRAQEPERKATIRIGDEMIVRGDRGLLRVVIENLLGNAWKFTSKNEHTMIRFDQTWGITAPPEAKNKLAFFIQDNGVGFDMKFVKKLFGTFQRLHAKSEFQGTGIGLATVQRIVHRHGGLVWGEGKINEGAVFYFCL